MTKSLRSLEKNNNNNTEESALIELQDELSRVKQARREDQFYFIFAIILIVDAILFIYLVDGLAALTLGLLQCIFIVVLADRFDIKYIEIIFNKITRIFKKEDN